MNHEELKIEHARVMLLIDRIDMRLFSLLIESHPKNRPKIAGEIKKLVSQIKYPQMYKPYSDLGGNEPMGGQREKL